MVSWHKKKKNLPVIMIKYERELVRMVRSFYAWATVKWGTATPGKKARPTSVSLQITTSEVLVSGWRLMSQFSEVSVNFFAKDLYVYHDMWKVFIALAIEMTKHTVAEL